MSRLYSLACIAGLLSGFVFAAEGQAIKPRITLKIEPKAVWLLESAATRLRAAETVSAVSRSYHYSAERDTVPYSVEIDTVRFKRSVGGYRSSNYLGSSGFSVEVESVTQAECLRFFHSIESDGNNDTPLTKVDTELRRRAMATMSNGVATRRDCGRNKLSFPSPLQALNAKEIGNKLDVGIWGIERLDDPMLHSISYEGKKSWEGRLYDVVQFTYEAAATLPKHHNVYTTTMYLDGDQVVWRVITSNNKGNYRFDSQIESLTLDAPLTDSDITWPLPAGVAMNPAAIIKKDKSQTGLQIPEFTGTGQLLDGRIVTASGLYKRNKATLFWFWNTECSACIAKFPHLEQIYNEYKMKGVEIVAINVLEPKDDLDKSREYQVYNQSTMPIVFAFGDWNEWSRKNIFVVVDGSGKIVYDGIPSKSALRSLFARLTSDSSM